MDISFRTLLSCLLIAIVLVSGVIAVLSNPWLMLGTIAACVIEAILAFDDFRTHEKERDEFRNGIVNEVLNIMRQIGTRNSTSPVNYPHWVSRIKSREAIL